MASTLRSAVIAIAIARTSATRRTPPPAGNLPSAYAGRSELEHGGQQPVHLGLVVVVDEPGADGAAGVPQAARAGQLPRVVVAPPHVDLAASQAGRDRG